MNTPPLIPPDLMPPLQAEAQRRLDNLELVAQLRERNRIVIAAEEVRVRE